MRPARLPGSSGPETVALPPPWFTLSLLCALSWALLDALCKRALQEHPVRAVLGARWWYGLPPLLATIAFDPVPPLDRAFWLSIAVSAPLEIVAMHLYMRAIKMAPLSQTAPLLAWTPVFSAAFSAVVLGERPNAAGAAGFLLVAAGSWLLYVQPGCTPLQPLRALVRERGAQLMFAVALIFSATSALGKLGVVHSSAAFFGPSYVGVLAFGLALTGMAKGEGRTMLAELAPNRWFFAIGAAVAAMTLLHFAALSRTQVAYMLAVKRSGIIVSVILGRVVFGESGLGVRLPGAALLLAGVILLGLFGR